MRQWLSGAILLGSAVACILAESILFRMFRPPDATSAVIGAVWVAMPFLVAAWLALSFRRNTPVLVVLLISLLIAGPIGVSILDATATQIEVAEREAKDAVLPGEDPSRGPAAMRKSGADAGVTIGTAFSILAVVFVPPAQLVAIVIPTLIGYGVAALVRKRKAERSDNRMSDAD